MSVKSFVRNGVARVLYAAGLTRPSFSARGALSIATFHRVLPEQERRVYPYPGLVVTPTELDAFLRYFSQHFDCGTLATQHSRHQRGDSGGKPLLALTFDDGQHDNLLHAQPVLARHGLNATFFIPVDAVRRRELLWHDRLGFPVLELVGQGLDGLGVIAQVLKSFELPSPPASGVLEHVVEQAKRLPLASRLRLVQAYEDATGRRPTPEFARLMTAEELAELGAGGHEIGSHSMTHCLMTECGDSDLAFELEQSRAQLQQWTGQQVESFCYPNGNADARTAAAAARAGYARAVTTRWGGNPAGSDALLLRRFDMDVRRVYSGADSVLPSAISMRMSNLTRVD